MASPTDLANLFGWYKADAGLYDATSGGSAVTADGAAIARWEDQSGGARHLTQSTSGNRQKLDATKGLVVGQMPDNTWWTCPGSYTLDRRDFSVFLICELTNLRKPQDGASVVSYHFITHASGDTLNLHYDGGATTANIGRLAGYDGSFKLSTSRPLTTERCLVGFVGTASGLKCWVDGANTSATALTAGSSTLTSLLGAGASNYPAQAGVRDLIVYTRALSDSEVTDTLLAYARSDRGVASSREHQVVFDGDSLTHGYGATLNRNWPSKLTGIPQTVRRRVTAQSGISLATLASTASTVVDALFVSGEDNVLCIFAGTNDIDTGSTGVATADALETYCLARQTAGYKVVVFTMLPRGAFNGTQDGYVSDFNTQVRADWATYADAICDVAADSRLDDATDTTYFDADQIHLKDAGLAVVVELAEPEILGLLPSFGPPTNSVAPAVTGTEANGKTLSSTSGTWSGSPTYAYQWYTNTAASTSGGTAIGGATSSTFVLTDSQDDLYVYCVVTATNDEGSDTEPSNVVGPILGLNVVVKNNPVFADVADFDQETLFNEAIGDDGTGEEMPAPTTWNTDSPVGDIDWSAFTLAVDANAINRSNRAGATLITPNYVVLAAHAPGDNTGHTWMTPAGAEVTRTLGSTPDVDYWELGTGDLAVAKLSAAINNITPMPLILDSSKVAGRDALCIEMDRHLNVFTIPETLDNTDEDCTVSHSRASDGLESGDSGKPCVIIIDGTPVMVITAMFTASPGGPPFTGTGPNASHFIDEIFAITAEDGESPTVWDLQIASGGRASGIASSFASVYSSTGFPFYF